jgi:hypothetical protein
MMVLLGACTALPATQPVQSVDYYAQLLGPKPSDTLDFANAPQTPEDRATLGAARGYFTHYGTDHHVFVLYNKKVMKFRVDALDSDAYCLQLYDYREQAG